MLGFGQFLGRLDFIGIGVRFKDFDNLVEFSFGVRSSRPKTTERLKSLGVLAQELSCLMTGDSGVTVPMFELSSLVNNLSARKYFSACVKITSGVLFVSGVVMSKAGAKIRIFVFWYIMLSCNHIHILLTLRIN